MSDSNKKILIVEDEPSMVKVLSDKFLREGFLVSTAKNGEEGLASALREHPDLMLLDIVMPKMSGLEVMEKLRTDEWGKTAAIILLTNLSPDDKTLKKIEKFEPTYYFVKADMNINDLVAKVRGRLGLN